MEITFDTILSIATLLLGGGGIGAFFTWRYVRREAAAKAKEKEAEAKSAEVDMAQKIQETYQEMLEDKQKEVEDNHRLIDELRTDRDHYRDGYIEMRNRLDKTDENVRGLQREVARYGRVVDGMRPFLCYDTKCKKRQRVPQSQCEGVDAAAKTPLKCTITRTLTITIKRRNDDTEQGERTAQVGRRKR